MILKYRIWVYIFLCLICYSFDSFSAPKLEDQDYFASFRASKVNVRSGPGQDYPIKFTFKSYGIPIKVISLYDNWNEIKDFDGDTGWVNQNLLTKKRTVIVKIKNKNNSDFVRLHSAARNESKTLLLLENDVIAHFIRCNQDWCAIKIDGKRGWVNRGNIWGIDNRD